MLGSHNTFTYLPPRNPIFSLFRSVWRCQSRSIEEQYEKGVRFFDIRLIWSEKRNRWEVGHGLVRVKGIYFSGGLDLEDYMSKFPGSQYRVILERGNNNDRAKFEEDFLLLKDSDIGLVDVIIKKPWEIIYRSPQYPRVVKDYCVRLFGWNREEGFWKNLTENLDLTKTIKKWAKKNNPPITPDLINDETLHFIDCL